MNDDLLALHEYHVWANEKLLNHLRGVPDVFTAPVSGPFPTIASTFGHIYDVDTIWFKRMQGESPDSFEDTSFAHADAAMARFASLHRAVREFLKNQDGSRLIRYRNTQGEWFENRLSDLLRHMVNHGTYHRGNVTVMLYQAGLKGIATDYIYFLRERP